MRNLIPRISGALGLIRGRCGGELGGRTSGVGPTWARLTVGREGIRDADRSTWGISRADPRGTLTETDVHVGLQGGGGLGQLGEEKKR